MGCSYGQSSSGFAPFFISSSLFPSHCSIYFFIHFIFIFNFIFIANSSHSRNNQRESQKQGEQHCYVRFVSTVSLSFSSLFLPFVFFLFFSFFFFFQSQKLFKFWWQECFGTLMTLPPSEQKFKRKSRLKSRKLIFLLLLIVFLFKRFVISFPRRNLLKESQKKRKKILCLSYLSFNFFISDEFRAKYSSIQKHCHS